MDFSKLSSDDLNEFSSIDYGIPTDETLSLEDRATQLFNQLKNKDTEFPYPVIDLYLATNYLGPRDKTYTYDQIMNLSKDEIKPFLDLFNILSSSDLQINRERIFRILTYLNLINWSTELIQPHMIDYLCSTLTLDELNNFRQANNLSELNCRIFIVRWGGNDMYYDKLTEYNFNHLKTIQQRGPERTAVIAVENNDLDLFKLSLEFNVDSWYMVKYRPDLLNYLLNRNRIDMLQYWIDIGLDINKYPALEYCIASSRLEKRNKLPLVKKLVENGADVNLSGWFSSPLGEAVRISHFRMVKYLVEQGADVNQVPPKPDHHNIIHSPIRLAIQNNYFLIIKYLVEQGADVNDEVNLEPPLLLAVMKGDLHTIKFLVMYGANINWSDDNGNTILDRFLYNKILGPCGATTWLKCKVVDEEFPDDEDPIYDIDVKDIEILYYLESVGAKRNNSYLLWEQRMILYEMFIMS